MAAFVGRAVPRKSLTNGTVPALETVVMNGNVDYNGDAPALIGRLEDVTVNKGQKVEYFLKVAGKKPLAVTWYRNGTKLKSNKNMKVTYSSSQGETKMLVMESDAEDDGEYRVEVTNDFGKAELSCIVTVILPEKLIGVVKQKDRSSFAEDMPELKKFQKRGSVVELLQKTDRRGSTRGSVTALPDKTLLLKVISEKPAVAPPGKPSRPEVVNIGEDSAELKWAPSTDDTIESYDVQMKVKAGDWEQSKSVSGEESTALVLGLEEGQEYEFRIIANNEGGSGQPSDATPPIVPKKRNAKPYIDRSSFKPSQTVKRGQTFNIAIKYIGEPHPVVTWTKGSETLTSNAKLKIENVDHTSTVTWLSGERPDAGTYKLTATNDLGGDSAEIELTVIGAPGMPRGPIVVKDVQKDSILIGWNPPEDDGGKPITGYVVEKKDVKASRWEPTTYPVGADVTEFRVPDLTEGEDYLFRVKAKNDEGLGDPLDSDTATKAKNAFDTTKRPGKPQLVNSSKTLIHIKWTKPDYTGTTMPLTPIGYNVKRKTANTTEPCAQVNTGTVMDLEFTDHTVVANQLYQYEITAVNDGLESVPSEPSDVIKAAPLTDAARLDMSGLGGKEICLKVGEQLNVNVPVTGVPMPVITWHKDNKTLAPSARVKQETTGENTQLLIPSAVRGDTGKYKISAKNEFGEDSGDFSVVVISPPGCPKGPMEILDVQKESVLIGWNPPDDDGGRPITAYIVEKMNMNAGKWDPTNHSVGPDVKEFRIPKLKEGDDYKFRVRAKNDQGLSEPLDSDKSVKVKNPFNPADAPGSPEVVDSAKNFIKIKWTKPKRDGGAPVTGYNVERKDPRTGTWSPVNDEPVASEEFTDNTVVAYKDYQYRVTALNEGGESKPSDPSGIITARPLREAPKIDLSKLGGKEIRVRAGEQIKVDVPVTGAPAPVVSWQKEKKALSQSDRLRLDSGDEKAMMFIPSAVRGDTGGYTVLAKNEFGEDSGDFSVVVLDKPPAPSNLSVQDVFADRCTLTWKAPADDGGAEISGYVIERKEEEDDFWQTLPDVVTNTSHTVKGLKKGKKYHFRVRAENIYGVSDPVQTDKAVLAKNPYDCPGAPGQPEVTDADKDHISIKWAAPKKDGGSPITGYNVERKDPKTGRWSKVNGEQLVKEREFTDTKVLAGREYEYSVKAVNAGGESEPSEVSAPIKAWPLKAVPQIDRSALEAVDSRVRAGNSLSIQLPFIAAPPPSITWSKDGNNLEDSSRIRQRVADDETIKLEILSCKRSDSGVYGLTASNKFGTDSVNFNVVILDKPGIPEDLQVSDVEADSCKLTWQPPKDNGGAEIHGYIVEKCEEEIKFWSKVNGVVLDTSYLVKNLEPQKKYLFRVRAENVYGISDPLETKNAILTKMRCMAPSMESELREQTVDKGDTLKVKIPFSGTGPFSFALRYGNRDITDKSDRVKLVPFDDHVSLQIKDAAASDTGRYKVEVTNSAGVGSCSIPVRVKAPPGKCSGLTVTDITKSGCRLTWRPPTDDGGQKVTNYVVEKQLVGKYWSTVTSFAKETSVEVKGLSENKEYFFRVAAANTNGTGEWLETPTAIVAKMQFNVPGAPGEPKAEEIGADFVSLTWPKPLHNGGGRILGYYVEKKEADSEVWFRINAGALCPACIFSVPNLIENKKYDFRVFAVNEAGESQPAATAKRILVKDPKDNEPDRAPHFPFPLRDRFIQEGHGVKLFASVIGQPKPVCEWFKEGKPLSNGDRYSIACLKGVCSLEISSCKPADAGRYTCTAKNPLGSAETTCKLDISPRNGFN